MFYAARERSAPQHDVILARTAFLQNDKLKCEAFHRYAVPGALAVCNAPTATWADAGHDAQARLQPYPNAYVYKARRLHLRPRRAMGTPNC